MPKRREDLACLSSEERRDRRNARRRELRLQSQTERAIKRGARVEREDCGGAVGGRWLWANRSGERLDTSYVERALSGGDLVLEHQGPNGDVYRAVRFG